MMHQREPMRPDEALNASVLHGIAQAETEAAYHEAVEQAELVIDPVEKIEVLSELISERIAYLQRSATAHPLRGDIGDWRVLKALAGIITEQSFIASEKLHALREASDARGAAIRQATGPAA